MIFINPRFPKTKKAYNQTANDNIDRLKSVMSNLAIAKPDTSESVLRPKASGGYVPTHGLTKSKKEKTFKL